MSVLSRGLEPDLSDLVTEVLDRWPSAGLAVAVVRDGRLAWFRGDGVANASSRRPVTQDTVFRVGSVTRSDRSGSRPRDRTLTRGLRSPTATPCVPAPPACRRRAGARRGGSRWAHPRGHG